MSFAQVIDRLLTKRARITEEIPPDSKWSFPTALEKVEFLLQYAADTGVIISPTIAKTISRSKNAYDNRSLDPDLEAEFWVAFTTLRSTVKLDSLEGIGSHAYASARRTKTRYNIWGAVLLVLVIIISAITISGRSFISDINSIIDRTCKTQSSLDCEKRTRKGNDLNVQAIGTATYQIWEELWWLNIFLAGQSIEDIRRIYRDKNEVDGQFLQAMWEAGIIEAKFKTFYETIISGILPIIYTILRAVAFGVRDLRKRTADRTWTETSEMSATLRLFLAVFVGAVLGIFTDFAKGISLSPIAVGFLAGYGVEFFFDFLDNLLGTLGFRSKSNSQIGS